MNRPRVVALYTLFVVLTIAARAPAQRPRPWPAPTPAPVIDYASALEQTLEVLAAEADSEVLRVHYRSIADVVRTADPVSARDAETLERLYRAFTDPGDPHRPTLAATYLERMRPLIVAWVSPMDGAVSFAWLTLPAAWEPEREYPLYVQLHGLWDVASTRLDYLLYPFEHLGGSFAFEDGYALAPWGRGNQWYRFGAEIDVWECLDVVEGLVRIDPSRRYMTGHSMGGYGAWHLAQQLPEPWAAVGVHAGALWHDQSELSIESVARLRDVPTYFVVGDRDPLYAVNLSAFQTLRYVGNARTTFVSFAGAHEYRQADVERMYLWLREFSLEVPAGD